MLKVVCTAKHVRKRYLALVVLCCATSSYTVNCQTSHPRDGSVFDPPKPNNPVFSAANVTVMSKTVTKKVLSVEQDEGVGARVRRSVGRHELRNLDPFLMLDEFRGTAPAGFPDHPHRGFETVSYLLKGQFQHEDFVGHRGVLNAGDLQWMTAGKGIVHCEMPYGDGEAHGLQLWVNLAKKDKMVDPAYQELLDKDIPKTTKDGVTVKVIAGESFGIKSPVYTRTPTMYLDFKMEVNSKLNQAIPQGWTSFIYILDGTGFFGPEGKRQEVGAHHTLVLSKEGGSVEVVNKGGKLLHFVLVGGQPLNEPIVQHGPFVMNTRQEIAEAINDYSNGPFVMNTEEEIEEALKDYQYERNGFENALTWNSFIITEDPSTADLLIK